jgi:Flp pilus assembly protein TadD
LLDWWPLGRWGVPAAAGGRTRGTPRFLPPARLWREKAPLLALAAGSSAVTLAVQSRTALASLEALPLPVRAAHALVAYVRYLGKTLWPADLSFYYTQSRDLPPAGTLFGAALLLAALTTAAILLRRTRPALLVGWFWFLGTLVPVIGLVQVGSQGLADRYTYLPLIGPLIAVAWAAGALAGRGGAWRPVKLVGAAVAIVVLCLRTGDQVAAWRDDRSIAIRALEVDPGNWMAHRILGQTLAAAGDTAGAIAEYRRALEFQPDNAYVLADLGVALLARGQTDEGIGALRRALELEPLLTAGRGALGRALASRGDFGGATAELREAVRLAPGDAAAHYNLGLALALSGDHAGAAASLRKALRLDPASADALTNLGLVLAAEGRLDEAAARHREAIGLDPRHARAHNNLGALYASQGRLREARDEFRMALEIDPGLAQARKNLQRLEAQRPGARSAP